MRGRDGRAQAGFTLIEVLIAIGLTAILFLMLMAPVVQSMSYFRTATARADAQTVARNALDAMTRELSDALYVQLDMEDNSTIAFIPPLRVDPSDPTSDVVTPPRPDWSREVRFWRALNDPRAEYSTGTHLTEPNAYFLARTVVPDPFRTDDAWNPRNEAWAEAQANTGQSDIRIDNWAPLPRVVSWESVDPGGTRRNTYQPGYPYLAMKQLYGANPAEFARRYRDAVVGMTPMGNEYDVRSLSFEPLVVSGEWLTPAQGRLGQNKSTYIARYPLWRLGTTLAGWPSLSQYLPIPITQDMKRHGLAYDPFLLVYHYRADLKQYELKSVCWFDRRSRSMRVTDITVNLTGTNVYDTYAYPFRSTPRGTAFNVDWIQGIVRFDFPPFTKYPESSLTSAAVTGTYDQPVPLEPESGENRPLQRVGTSRLYEAPLGIQWKDRTDPVLDCMLLPETLTVQVDTNHDGKPERTLRRVERPPRDYADEYQLGLIGRELTENYLPFPRYGYIRLPEHLAGGEQAGEDPGAVWVYYRWRSNGVVTLDDVEHPDLISAYYRTASVLDIGITVARADVARKTSTGERVTQSVHMTRRVKLPSAVREVHDVES